MGERLTAAQIEMLEGFAEGADDFAVPVRSPVLASLIRDGLVMTWEDGDFVPHARISPAGRAVLERQP